MCHPYENVWNVIFFFPRWVLSDQICGAARYFYNTWVELAMRYTIGWTYFPADPNDGNCDGGSVMLICAIVHLGRAMVQVIAPGCIVIYVVLVARPLWRPVMHYFFDLVHLIVHGFVHLVHATVHHPYLGGPTDAESESE